LVGLRPTPGVIPAAGDVFNPLPVVGPIARTAADAALLLTALRGRDQQLPLARPVTDAARDSGADGVAGLRIAWSADLGGLPVEPDGARVLARSRQTLEAAGAVTVDAEPELGDADAVFMVLRAVMMAGAYGSLARTSRDQLKDTLIWNIEQGLALTGPQVAAALARRSEIFRRTKTFLRGYD